MTSADDSILIKLPAGREMVEYTIITGEVVDAKQIAESATRVGGTRSHVLSEGISNGL